MTDQWDDTADVLVVGSGGAALTAAVTAAARGAEVLLLERSDRFGGTTAYSGGKIWIPNNHHMVEDGIADAPELARTYLHATIGKDHLPMIDAFLTHGPEMVKHVEAITPLRFYVCTNYPDYHPALPGAGVGRALDALPYDASGLGEYLPQIRRSPIFLPFTHEEWERWRSPLKFDYQLLGERIRQGVLTVGAALVAALFQGCLNHGVRPCARTRVTRLVWDGSRVQGVEADRDGVTVRLGGRRGVIIASGGFEWNEELKRQFLAGPGYGAGSPPWNEGDGLIMAAEIGARLGNMSEAWWMPLMQIPGEEADGRPLFRSMISERGLPGSIIVNRKGRRFVNEAHNYNDISKTFHHFDPVAHEYANLPAWLLFDSAFRQRYAIGTVMPGEPVPAWISTAATLPVLAKELGIDPVGLQETVERFNRFAREGQDPDFGRGHNLYDRYFGDAAVGINPSLAPLEVPPYYALQVIPGMIGTKGGLVTDDRARVLNWRGDVLPGLYAAGNVAAFWLGRGYPGPGASIGPGMTFGYLAALDAVHSG